MAWGFFRRLFGQRPHEGRDALDAEHSPSAAPIPRNVRRLMRQLDQREWPARRLAAVQLGQQGAVAVGAIPILVETLVDPHEEVRQAAAGALDRIASQWPTSPRVGLAVPSLVRALGDGRPPDVSRAAAQALDRLGVAAGPALTRFLREEENLFLRMMAARRLGMLASHAAPAARTLVSLLRAEQHPLREVAAETLGRIGAAASEVSVEPLAQTLTDSFPPVRRAAALALAALGPAARSAEPALRRALEDPYDTVREAAQTALQRVTGG